MSASLAGRGILPRPQWVRQRPEVALSLSADTRVRATPGAWREAARFSVLLKRDLELDLPVEFVPGDARDAAPGAIVAGLLGERAIDDLIDASARRLDERVAVAEGYVLDVSARRALVAGFDAAGLSYGLQLLRQLAVQDSGRHWLPGALVYDWPYKTMRGVHLFMPGRDDLPFFYRLLELLAQLRYNQVFLEVGGGMRYDRHPEINVAWEEFVRAARAYPDGPQGLQRSQSFPKDSTHTELGRGSYLDKQEIRDIVEYGRSLHIEVLPEVPSLSHAYYLACAHPEIAERSDDPYPDTYCPSNPASYDLLFDVMDEVIEVFEPRIVHVGHDEVYTYGICPRCAGKSGGELIAGDINRIHGYLHERGIRMAMWGDKLMDIVVGGSHEGGRERRVGGQGWFRAGKEYVMAATYQARDRVPKDILIFDWYWALDYRSERYFGELGFEEIYGNFGQNFGAAEFRNWPERASASNVLGAEVSTWCAVSEYALARNACLFNFLFASEMLWWRHYTDRERPRVLGTIVARQPHVRDFLGNLSSPSLRRGAAFSPISLSGAGSVRVGFGSQLPKSTVLLRGAAFAFDGAGTRGLQVDARDRSAGCEIAQVLAHSLLFVHHCSCQRRFRPTWAFADPLAPSAEDRIGTYTVAYADGGAETIEVRFGENIADQSTPYGEDVAAACYWAEPVWEGADEEGRPIVLCCYEWLNPRPTVPIQCLHLSLDGDVEGAILLAALTAVWAPLSADEHVDLSP